MITMLDTITPGALANTPAGDAYAGYVAGRWPDYDQIVRDFPHHHYVSIAIHPGEIADFADFEQGDFQSIPDLVDWMHYVHSKGVWRPGVYASESVLEEQISPALRRVLPRAFYRKWGAWWTGRADLPFDWDAHQYQDHGPHGENYDMSVVRDDFFPRHVTHPQIPPMYARAEFQINPKHNGGHWTIEGIPRPR